MQKNYLYPYLQIYPHRTKLIPWAFVLFVGVGALRAKGRACGCNFTSCFSWLWPPQLSPYKFSNLIPPHHFLSLSLTLSLCKVAAFFLRLVAYFACISCFLYLLWTVTQLLFYIFLIWVSLFISLFRLPPVEFHHDSLFTLLNSFSF